MHRILKELSLVFVLLLDVRVDVSVLCLLMFDKIEETLVDSDLELLMVICVLDHLVDGILHIVDEGIVVADDVAIRCDCFGDEGLADAQVLNHYTKVGVDRIVLL